MHKVFWFKRILCSILDPTKMEIDTESEDSSEQDVAIRLFKTGISFYNN